MLRNHPNMIGSQGWWKWQPPGGKSQDWRAMLNTLPPRGFRDFLELNCLTALHCNGTVNATHLSLSWVDSCFGIEIEEIYLALKFKKYIWHWNWRNISCIGTENNILRCAIVLHTRWVTSLLNLILPALISNFYFSIFLFLKSMLLID